METFEKKQKSTRTGRNISEVQVSLEDSANLKKEEERRKCQTAQTQRGKENRSFASLNRLVEGLVRIALSHFFPRPSFLSPAELLLLKVLAVIANDEMPANVEK